LSRLSWNVDSAFDVSTENSHIHDLGLDGAKPFCRQSQKLFSEREEEQVDWRMENTISVKQHFDAVKQADEMGDKVARW
jgi:hypothetical protein